MTSTVSWVRGSVEFDTFVTEALALVKGVNDPRPSAVAAGTKVWPRRPASSSLG